MQRKSNVQNAKELTCKINLKIMSTAEKTELKKMAYKMLKKLTCKINLKIMSTAEKTRLKS